MPTRTPEHRSIQRISTVCRRLDNVHPTTLYRWEQKGQFPKRVTVGPNMVGWYTDEIDQWLVARERHQDTGRPSPNPKARVANSTEPASR
jgi:predicted DNA-binding transcriptional regulator AlpA